MAIDHLYALLDGLLRPFSEDDKNFIRGYWHIVTQSLLTNYQRQDEHDLANTINYAQLNEKSFYWPLVAETETVTLSVSVTPVTLPHGLYGLECNGPAVRHEAVLDLPTRIDYATDVSCEAKDAIIDGNIVLGTGSATVVWWTTRVTDFTFVDNVLSSASVITSVTATRGTETDNTSRDHLPCEKMWDNVLFTKDYTTKYMRIGQPVVVNNLYSDTVTEIIDAHRFKLGGIHGGTIGTSVSVAIDLFPYSYPCEMDSIPEFREGYLSGVDYILSNGVISFPFPVTDTLIALRAYKPSTLIHDRFVQYLKDAPDDPSLYKIWWHDIFTGGLELFLHAAMGYPYTLPEMGNQRCIGFEYLREWGHGSEEFAVVEDEYNRITGTFAGNETSILVNDGRMYKIVRHYPDASVEIDRSPHSTTFTGESGSFVVSSIILQDDVGAERHFGVKAGCFPVVTPGDIIAPWTKLTTGIRIFDKHDRTDYNDFEDVSRFIVPGQTIASTPDILSMLAFNTFVIEVDSPLDVEDRLIRYLIPSWAQYHVRNRQERIRLFDFAETSIAATLLFAKILPVDIVPLTSSLNIFEYCENKSLIDADIPRKIIADYAGAPANIINIRDELGNPLDLTPLSVSKIMDYDADLAAEFAVGTESTVLNGGAFLTVVADNGLSNGVNLEFMFVEQSRLHVLDLTGHRGDLMDQPFLPQAEVKRVNTVRWYFTAETSGGFGLQVTPAIYSLGDTALTDQFIQTYTASVGTILVGDTVSYTDFKRLGTRRGMFFVNDTDHIAIDSFSVHGEPVLSSMPVHATLTGTWGFYCLVVEHDDGAIKTYFED